MFLALFLASVISAEPDSITPHAAALRLKASSELKRSKEDLSLAKKARVNQAYRGPKKTNKGFVLSNANEKRSAIGYFEDEISHWEKALRGEFVTLPDGELSLGLIGLVGGEVLVDQVVSTDAAIIDLNSAESRRPRLSPPRTPAALEAGSQAAFSAFQRARENASIEPYQKSRQLWIDMPTAGLVDESNTKITKPIVIVGTKKYSTAIGSTNTILRAKVLTDDDITEYRRLMTGKDK